MNFAKLVTKYFCGIDLHKKSMYICIMDIVGNILFHKNIPCSAENLIKTLLPYMPDITVGVESMFSYYWVYDTCVQHNIPFCLGHPFYLKSIHGGKKKNDKIDSKKITDLMRVNHFPVGFAYPKEMRATRYLLRRRQRLVSIRSEAMSHIQTLFSQKAMYDISYKEIKKKDERRKLVKHFDDPDIQANIQTDIELIEFLNPTIQNIEQQVMRQAKNNNRMDISTLLTVPGLGDILSMTILYEIYNISRFPSVQSFSSYSRLVKCDRSSAGKKSGGGNQKIGNPYLKWAFGQIIIRAQVFSKPLAKYYQRLQSQFGPKRAKSIIAHKFGVAVYFMLKNNKAFDELRFIQSNMK